MDRGDNSAQPEEQPRISEASSEKAIFHWGGLSTFLSNLTNSAAEPELVNPIHSGRFIRGQEVGRPTEWQLSLKTAEPREADSNVVVTLICEHSLTMPNVPVWAKFAVRVIDKHGTVLESSGDVSNSVLHRFARSATCDIRIGTPAELNAKRDEMNADDQLLIKLYLNIYKDVSSTANQAAGHDEYVPEVKKRCLGICNPNDDLKSLFGSMNIFWTTREETGDITLKCEGVNIKAHKSMLAGRSEVFQRMLNSNLFNSIEQQTQEIEISDVPLAIMNPFLEYIYKGSTTSFDWKNVDNVCALLNVAEKYFVNSLKNKCCQALLQMTNVQNFAKIAKAAFLYNSNVQFKNEIRHFFEIHQLTLNSVASFQEFAENDYDEFIQLFFYHM